MWTSPGRWGARSLNCGLHQGGGWQEVLIVDFNREVDGKKSLLSAVALRSNQVKYFPMELVNFVKGLTEVVDFTRKMDSKKS